MSTYTWTKEFKTDLRKLKKKIDIETCELKHRLSYEHRITHLETQFTRLYKRFEDLQSTYILKQMKETNLRQTNKRVTQKQNNAIWEAIRHLDNLLTAKVDDNTEQQQELDRVKHEIAKLKDSLTGM
jgi:chromosome segregation ATPase